MDSVRSFTVSCKDSVFHASYEKVGLMPFLMRPVAGRNVQLRRPSLYLLVDNHIAFDHTAFSRSPLMKIHEVFTAAGLVKSLIK